MDRTRHEFFAGSAFAGDENRAVSHGHLGDGFQHAAQRGACADDVLEAVFRAELALEEPILGLESAVFDGLPDEPAHDVEMSLIEGFFQIPVGTGSQRFDRALGASVAGDDDAGQVRCDLVNLPHQFESVDSGHLDVHENEIDRLARDEFDRRRGVACGGNIVATADENALECAPIEFLVVNDKDVGFAQWDCLRFAEGGGSILESPAGAFKRPDFETDRTVMGPSSAASLDNRRFSPARSGEFRTSR